MWPWEHAIFGYVAYSAWCHAVYRDSPDGRGALCVIFASLLPDLIDKTLAWEFGVFASGYALGHSVFFAVPLSAGAVVLARRIGYPRTGIAFAVGYLLHLLGDAVPEYLQNGELPLHRFLWPISRSSGDPERGEFVGRFLEYFVPYLGRILSLDLTQGLLAQLVIATFALSLWIYDGFPGLREVIRLR
ncbi:metal-dependent hydrolase [Halegenticoccus soli]|uniref:metal-dependent hydrolase n=1 Tax=Halegenticoccus soli TaxID=1985678 RepID=UPI000C6E3F4B|nr:metal-dependent hydrolase [Halegenticoccus soli]